MGFDGEEVVIKEIKWSNIEWDNFVDEIAACKVNYWKNDYYGDGTLWYVEIKLPLRQKYV